MLKEIKDKLEYISQLMAEELCQKLSIYYQPSTNWGEVSVTKEHTSHTSKCKEGKFLSVNDTVSGLNTKLWSYSFSNPSTASVQDTAVLQLCFELEQDVRIYLGGRGRVQQSFTS